MQMPRLPRSRTPAAISSMAMSDAAGVSWRLLLEIVFQFLRCLRIKQTFKDCCERAVLPGQPSEPLDRVEGHDFAVTQDNDSMSNLLNNLRYRAGENHRASLLFHQSLQDALECQEAGRIYAS